MANAGNIEIGVKLNDAAALAGMDALQAKAARTTKSIDRMRADVAIDVRTAEFDRKIDRAKLRIKKWSAEVEKNKELGLSTKRASAYLARAKKELKQWDGQRATAILDYRVDTRQLKVAEGLAKLHEARLREQLRLKKDMVKATYDATVGVAEEDAQVAKLNKRYSELAREVNKSKKAFGYHERVKVNIDQTAALAEMEALKAKLAFMGHTPPIGIKTEVESDFSVTLSKIGKALANIGNVTIRLGPFTTSIKQAGAILGLLGSSVVDVFGSVGALIGVLGTGIAGAAAIGSAGLIGMVLQFGGVFAAMKPLVVGYKNITTASNAYDKAVLQYGKGSKQATVAQEKLNSTLKGTDPAVRSAVKTMSSVRQEWAKLTQESAKKNFGTILNETAKTAKAVLPGLARNTNETMNIIGKATESAMKRLRSSGGKAGLETIGANFNAGLKPALAGLEHLGAALGKIAVSASRFLAPMGSAFQRWASGLDTATNDTDRLDGSLNRLADHAKTVGALFMSFGRLMGAVMNGGADAGNDFAGSMTKTMDRWTAFLKSTEGRGKSDKFFRDAVSGTKSLWRALEPMIKLFIQWSTIFSPILRSMSAVLAVIGNIGSALLKVTGAAEGWGAVMTTVAALFVGGKLLANFAKITEALSIARTLMKAQAGLSLAGALSTGAGQAFGAGGGLLRAAPQTGAIIASEMSAAAPRIGAIIGAEMSAGAARGGAVAGVEEFAGTALGARGIGRAAPLAEGAAMGAGARTSKAGVILAGREAEKLAATGAAAAGASKGLGMFARGGMAIARALPFAAAGTTAFSATATVATGGLYLLAAGAAYGAYKILTHVSAQDKLNKKLKENVRDIREMQRNNGMLTAAFADSALATNDQTKAVGRAVDIKKQLRDMDAAGLSGTEAYKAKLAELTAAINVRTNAENNAKIAKDNLTKSLESADKLEGQVKDTSDQATAATNARVEAEGRLTKAEKGRPRQGKAQHERNIAAAQKELTEARRKETLALQQQADASKAASDSENIRAASYLQERRVLAGMPALSAAAAASLGALVAKGREGQKLAERINRDKSFWDPKDTGRVADAANPLVGKVSNDILTKIVVDSHGAEAAVRAFQAIQKQIPPQVVSKIIAHTEGQAQVIAMNALLKGANKTTVMNIALKSSGKAELLAMKALAAGASGSKILRVLADVKDPKKKLKELEALRIAAKQVKIIASGGKAAESQIERLTNKKIAAKVIKIMASSDSVESKLAQLKGLKLPKKTQQIIASAIQADATKKKVEGQKIRPVTQAINRTPPVNPSGWNSIAPVHQRIIRDPPAKATGAGGRETPGTQSAIDRALSRTSLNSSSTTQASMGMRVSGGPRMIVGEEPQHPEYVLSTNPAYRKSNISHLRSAASAMGVKMFAAGGRLGGMGSSWQALSSKRKSAMTRVDNSEKKENIYRFELDRTVGLYKEPSSEELVTKTGVDKYGNDKYEVNKPAVDQWSKQVEHISGMFAKMRELILATQQTILSASETIAGIVEAAKGGKDSFHKAITTENRIINSKASKKKKDAAERRKANYQRAYDGYDQVLGEAYGDRTSLSDKKEETRQRLVTNEDDVSEWKDTYRGIQGVALAALSDKDVQAPDPLSAASDASSLIDFKATRDKITTDKLRDTMSDADKSIFDIASGYLDDTNLSNDSAAGSAINSLLDKYTPKDGGTNAVDDGGRAAAALALSQGNATRNAQALATFQGYGDIGGGGFNAYNAGQGGYNPSGMGGTVVNINTLHPGDPQVALAVANATSTGYGYQGGIGTSRGQVG